MIPGATYIEDRRKSAWRSNDSRGGTRHQGGGATHSPSFGPMSSSPVVEKKKGILSGKLFSKRRGSNPPPPPSSQYPAEAAAAAAAAAQQQPQPSDEAIARGVDILQSIFRKWDRSALHMMLEANAYVMEETITAILNMEEIEAESNSKRKEAADSDGFSLQFPVKNVLPDDFLQLPDSDDTRSDDEREDDEDGTGDERQSELLDDESRPSVLDSDEVESKSSVMTASEVTADDQSEKSFAEDDGTLYGKEFGSDDEELQEDVITPVFDSETIRKSNQMVSDSMNRKFLPEELREEPAEGRPSILSTSNIEVIKRSKLDLTEAEKRIRHREPHLVFELLSKASEIYRHGVISSQELDTLRAMIVSKIQPSKMIIDTTMNMNKMITDHEWHGLILKAKGIRQALSVRLVNNAHRLNRITGHVEYMIRVVDVESGVVWFTKKRFKELYKLYRKLCRFSERVSDCFFPPRRSHRVSAVDLASDRAPALEAFLRASASLVTPSPLTFLHGCALKQLQQFLDVPHDGILLRNRTQPISRDLRVFVYHTVNDQTSPEGKACAKFLTKLRQNGVDPGKNLLDEVATILDGVQEYMLEHRFDEMRASVERLMKVLTAAALSEDALGRRNSYVNLLSDDSMTSNDKLQQLISDAIRHELEERLCVPLMHALTTYLRTRVAQKEQQFRQRIFQLRGKPQSYFGIPVSKISVSSWRTVIASIKEIDDAFLPLDKMRKLVAAAHQIHTLHRTERRMYREEKKLSTIRMSLTEAGIADAPSTAETAPEPAASGDQERADDDDVLSGDDFLPIFIYVIVHSDLAAPIMTQVLLNRLCDPEKRRSESGYYLATFEAALHHILSNESFEEP